MNFGYLDERPNKELHEVRKRYNEDSSSEEDTETYKKVRILASYVSIL